MVGVGAAYHQPCQIDCSVVDLAKNEKRLREIMGSLAARARRERQNTSTWASQLKQMQLRAMRPVNEGRANGPAHGLTHLKKQSSTNRKILRVRKYMWALLANETDGESYGYAHHADTLIVSRSVRIETIFHLPLIQSYTCTV